MCYVISGMTALELYQAFRREDIQRRRRLGWRGRIAERAEHLQAFNEWFERWYAE